MTTDFPLAAGNPASSQSTTAASGPGGGCRARNAVAVAPTVVRTHRGATTLGSMGSAVACSGYSTSRNILLLSPHINLNLCCLGHQECNATSPSASATLCTTIRAPTRIYFRAACRDELVLTFQDQRHLEEYLGAFGEAWMRWDEKGTSWTYCLPIYNGHCRYR